MTRPRPGDLRHVLAYQTKTEALDDLGQPVETWTTALTVRARVESPTGRELLDAQRMQSQVSHVVTVRRPGTSGPFSPAGRFVEGTDVFNVVAVLPSNDGFFNRVFVLRSVAPLEIA